jgi:hypothetical protein
MASARIGCYLPGAVVQPRTGWKETLHARRDDRHGICGTRLGRLFSDFRARRVCVDKDAGKIETLNRGEIPDLRAGARRVAGQERRGRTAALHHDLSAALADADAVFIAVGTPTRRGDGHADLTYVYAAAEEIAAKLTEAGGRRREVDRAGRDEPRGARRIQGAASRTSRSRSRPTRNSCARAPRSRTSCAPTASSSARERSARETFMRGALSPAVAARDADRVHRRWRAPS